MRFNTYQYTRMLSNSMWASGGGLNFRSGTTSDLMTTVTSYNRNIAKYAARLAFGDSSSTSKASSTSSSASSRVSDYLEQYGYSKTNTEEAVRLNEVSRPRTNYSNNGIEEGKTSGERWDSYLEEVKKQAQKDAANGVYMSDDFDKLQNDYMDKYVAPDRDKATATADKVLDQAGNSYAHKYYQVKDTGSSKSAKSSKSTQNLATDVTVGVSKNNYNSSAEVYNSKGEMIAHKLNGQKEWTSVKTKAEDYAAKTTARVYADAYREAYNQVRSSEQAKMGTGTLLDVRV